MSSRKLLTLLDGIPGDSWYKTSVFAAMQEFEEEQQHKYGDEVRSQIWAQLNGQSIELTEETT